MTKKVDIFSAGDRETHRVELRSKLLVIFLVILIMSSGFLFYGNMPIFYFGILSLSVGIILLLMYITYYLTQGTPELFDGNGSDLADPSMGSGLERVLEAERRFDQKNRDRTIRSKNKEPTIQRSERTTIRSSKNKKRVKIGSIPIEETRWHEKYEISERKRSQEKPKTAEKVTTLMCPECGSKELFYEAGLVAGYKYHCKDCDYIGSFVIEKDFKV